MNIDETNMTVPQNWHELRNSIPALRDQTYLNTGVSGPPPTFALEEEVRWTRWLGETGPGRPDVMQEAFAELDRVRSAVAGFIGADEDQVALSQSCSDGMAVVAAGLPWQAGDEVVVSGELEHISGLLPWYDLQRRRGVVVRTVAARGGFLTADDVRRAMTDRTKLICMSHVAYNTGAQLPVADVAQLARDRGVWLLVDGAQGPGNVPVDVGRLGCHFYACAGQKWMLGPDGTGALYVAEEAVEAVQATHLGWASVVLEDKPVEQLRLHDGARRFEVAGKHVPSLAALRRSTEALRRIGMAAVENRIRHLVARFREGVSRVAGVHLVTPADPDLWSGLVVFRIDGVDVEEAVRRLWERRRIVIRWIPSPRALRASFHVFNTDDEVDALVEAVKELARESLSRRRA